VIRVLFVFHIVLLGWIFFRANTFSDAIFIITHLFTDINDVIFNILHIGQGKGILNFVFDLPKVEIFIAMIAMLVLGIHHIIQRKQSVSIWLSSKPILIRWMVYYGLLLSILVFGYLEPNEFIYFQF